MADSLETQAKFDEEEAGGLLSLSGRFRVYGSERVVLKTFSIVLYLCIWYINVFV